MRARAVLPAILWVVAAAAAFAADFDGARAFADLKALVRLGPRLPGSAASGQARGLIAERLRQAGWRSETRPVGAPEAGDRGAALVNVITRKARPGAKRVFLVTHYDTKLLLGGWGALVRTTAPPGSRRSSRSRGSSPTDSRTRSFGCSSVMDPPTHENLGSRALVRELERDGELKDLSAVVFVDMVADRELRLTPGHPRGGELAGMAANIAHQQGQDAIFDLSREYFVPGDHRAFLERGITSVLALVDFEFGGSSSPGAIWHTSRDDLSAVSEESLQLSGNLLLALTRKLGH